MSSIGKLLISAGVLLLLAGLFIIILNRLGFQPGKLPGDFVFKKGNTTVYLPITTSVVISIFITLLLWLFRK